MQLGGEAWSPRHAVRAPVFIQDGLSFAQTFYRLPRVTLVQKAHRVSLDDDAALAELADLDVVAIDPAGKVLAELVLQPLMEVFQ